MVSDILRTYVLFIYACGEIQWSSMGSVIRRFRGGGAVVGYNAAGDAFQNHALSGYSSIGDAISCTVDLGTRNKRQQGGTTTMPLTPFSDPQLNQICCIGHILRELRRITMEEVKTISTLLDPCPKTRKLANEDSAQFRPQPENADCYVSMRDIVYTLMSGEDVFPTQQCCYNDGVENDGYVSIYI